MKVRVELTVERGPEEEIATMPDRSFEIVAQSLDEARAIVTHGIDGYLEGAKGREVSVYLEGVREIVEASFVIPARDKSATIVFEIEHPGERAAGISAYSDEVTVRVASGSPGGWTDDEFGEFLRSALGEWYDGARVTIKGGGK